MSTASVPPPGWVEPQRAAIPLSAPERPALGGDFAAAIAGEDRRGLDSRRVAARIIDSIICSPVYFLALHQWGEVLGAWALMSLAHLVLAHFCEVTTGATPGKRIMRLRVADARSGALPSPQQAAARGVIGLVESNLIGLIALHVSKGRTRLGDRAAGTVVVDVERHGIASRALSLGALVYPVLWAIPVALVCVASAKGAVPGSYRHQADALCRQADAVLRRPDTDLFAAQDTFRRLDVALAQLQPPAAWQDRHTALVDHVHSEAVGLAGMLTEASRGRMTAEAAGQLAESYERQYATLRAAEKRAGYHECGH